MEKHNDLIKKILKGLLVLFLFFNSYLLQYIPVIIFKIDVKNMSTAMRILLSTFSNIILFLVLFFLYYKDLRREWKTFKEKMAENVDVAFKYWFLGLLGMFVSNFILIFLLKIGQAGNEQAVQKMIEASPWLMLIDAGLLAPFIEEMTFRKTFKDVLKNKWLFILISGVLFGAIHVLGSSTTLADYLFIIPYSSLGIAFAASYYKTDSVFTPILVHMIHNILLTLLSIL